MRLSELQNKDIINIGDGKKIGNIIDVVIDESGAMKSVIVEQVKGLSLFSNKDDLEIKWQQIEKIGEDVILVKLLL
ncbi:MAG: YlmC/YmxH family sporulation protein [Bacilli bacterium]|nr:YlmC/YmxH family sporulation protein [Bacilli bacterium]